MAAKGYRLTYRFESHDPPLTRAELDAKRDPEMGACDAAVIVSIIRPEHGGVSVVFVSMDGETKEPLEADEVWKAWAFLAFRLMDDPGLDEEQQAIAASVHAAVKRRVLRAREDVGLPM